MARAFELPTASGENESFTPDEVISQLIDSVKEELCHRKLERAIKDAKFGYSGSAH